jgi:hypothetical protein
MPRHLPAGARLLYRKLIMINMCTIKKLCSKPTADIVAQRQLDEARRQLLMYQSQSEYSLSMVRFYEASIKRLTAYVGEQK